jgi:hypothetical protein
VDYFNKKIVGLPKPKRLANNTGSKHRRKEYVHRACINGYEYYKVHVSRNSGKQCKIKYFKTFKEACTFVELLRLNPYL